MSYFNVDLDVVYDRLIDAGVNAVLLDDVLGMLRDGYSDEQEYAYSALMEMYLRTSALLQESGHEPLPSIEDAGYESAKLSRFVNSDEGLFIDCIANEDDGTGFDSEPFGESDLGTLFREGE